MGEKDLFLFFFTLSSVPLGCGDGGGDPSCRSRKNFKTLERLRDFSGRHYTERLCSNAPPPPSPPRDQVRIKEGLDRDEDARKRGSG